MKKTILATSLTLLLAATPVMAQMMGSGQMMGGQDTTRSGQQMMGGGQMMGGQDTTRSGQQMMGGGQDAQSSQQMMEQQGNESAREILEKRFAKGEISKEEFEDAMAVLRRNKE